MCLLRGVVAKISGNSAPKLPMLAYNFVEEHRGLGGNIISRLDNGDFAGLIYSLLVLTD